MSATRSFSLSLLALAAASPAFAEAPRVAVDIAPVHALVSQVMDGVGEADLITPPGASPHGYSMRPSEAEALQAANLVVWVGSELSPWLADSVETLAGDAHHLELLDVDGLTSLEFRTGATFEAHDHGDHDHGDHGDDDHDHEGHDHDDHAHDDDDHDHAHDDHAHDDQAHEDQAEAGHDHDHDHDHGEDHAHDHDGHDHGDHAHDHDAHDHDDHDHEEHAHDDHGHDDHGHDHTGLDPHAWLDPANARLWLGVIAEELAELDPDNAETYRANAEAAQAALTEQEAAIGDRIGALDGRFIVFHDAYQYFENRFGLEAAGAIRIGDAADPSPARVAEIRDLVAEQDISCVFTEPQFNRGMVDAVYEGTNVVVAEIDPLGADLEPGAGLYAELLDGMAASFEECLGG